jgi:hypothetical protein
LRFNEVSSDKPINLLEDDMSTNFEMVESELVVLRAGWYTANTQVFEPPGAALLTANAAGAPPVTAQFNVTYHGFSQAAEDAFQAAIDVWAITLTTPVTIRVEARWTPLNPQVLGSARPANVVKNFSSAPVADTLYPIALANKIQGSDLNAGPPHIIANFNSNFTNWYYGVDGLTPLNDYDLMSVVLHEIGHGLGFTGSMKVQNGKGTWGLGGSPLIWDRFIVNSHGEKLLDTSLFPNNSVGLAGQLQSNQLFFNGSNALATNANTPVRIYAPAVWEGGSSFSHLDEVTYPPGNPNSLMTPQIGRSEVIHSPGPLGVGILRDLGW